MEFAEPAKHRMKLKETKNISKYLYLAVGHEGDGDNNYSWCHWNTLPKRLEIKRGRVEIRGKVEIIQTIILLR